MPAGQSRRMRTCSYCVLALTYLREGKRQMAMLVIAEIQ